MRTMTKDSSEKTYKIHEFKYDGFALKVIVLFLVIDFICFAICSVRFSYLLMIISLFIFLGLDTGMLYLMDTFDYHKINLSILQNSIIIEYPKIDAILGREDISYVFNKRDLDSVMVKPDSLEIEGQAYVDIHWKDKHYQTKKLSHIYIHSKDLKKVGALHNVIHCNQINSYS